MFRADVLAVSGTGLLVDKCQSERSRSVEISKAVAIATALLACVSGDDRLDYSP